MIGISILGSTGSIGVNTLDVLAQHPDKFRVIALTANNNVEILYQQCLQWRPEYAVMADEQAAGQLQQRLNDHAITVLAGSQALTEIATLPQTDYVMAAIVGAAGLASTLAAAQAGKRILLANKEALVMAGSLLINAIKSNNAELLPVDSEHNALFQCMPAGFQVASKTDTSSIDKLILTASGGPFLNHDLSVLHNVTPEQACAHPNWDMGRKISVDSASMMNKGLEVIEAHWLYAANTDIDIEVVIHPQSIIHSLVAYQDGSVLAQLGNPDMRTPIAYSLAWPERISAGVKPLDLIEISRLDFMAPDLTRFPCLRLAFEAMQTGANAAVILNAANEIAVQAFLDGMIGFTDIAKVVEQTLSMAHLIEPKDLQQILDSDSEARQIANSYLSQQQLQPTEA